MTQQNSSEYCRDCGLPIALESDWPICKTCHVASPRADCLTRALRTLINRTRWNPETCRVETAPESIDVEHDVTVQMPPKSRTATVIVAREAWDALLARIDRLEAENRELRQLWIDTEAALVETRAALIDSNNHIIRLQLLISGKING